MRRSNQNNAQSFEERWSPPVAKQGYTQVPNYLLKQQSELGLSNSELVVLLQLMVFDFGSRSAEPAHSTLAKSIGVSASAVRHNLVSLEKKGFIKRTYRTGYSNLYSLIPTVSKLSSHIGKHPIKKQTGGYKKPGRPPPQKSDTKEYPIKRLNNKTESIKDILNNRFKEQ